MENKYLKYDPLNLSLNRLIQMELPFPVTELKIILLNSLNEHYLHLDWL